MDKLPLAIWMVGQPIGAVLARQLFWGRWRTDGEPKHIIRRGIIFSELWDLAIWVFGIWLLYPS